jgi:methylated-DNA-protein-cysteine methyltransferase-like protein
MPKDNDLLTEKVASIVKKIPSGRVTTYGSIAKCIGIQRSARTVGWILNSFKNRKDIPAHRVVNRNGLLTGKVHFGAELSMEDCLKNEGVEVKGDQIINLEKYFWNPCTE